MHIKIKLLVADDNAELLEWVLSWLPPACTKGELPVTNESHIPSWIEPLGLISRKSDSDGIDDVTVSGSQISVEIGVVRKQVLDAIANISKTNGHHPRAEGPDVCGFVNSPPNKESLTVREKDVLLLIAGGMATKEIAFALDVSPKTVDFHRDNIKKKIGVRSAALITRYAIEKGWA